ncbi:MAG: hypothetical protein EXR79_04220 [Myxococcales bacterium]|nr:hypothetical protein [Myxococcales bacterium]
MPTLSSVAETWCAPRAPGALVIVRAWVGVGAFVALCCGCVAATDTEYSCTKSASIATTTGKLHGEECTANADCKYGNCSGTALMLAGATTFKVCTKEASCGTGTQCSDDNDTAKGLEFTSIKAAAGAGTECAMTCLSAADCAKVNPKLAFCVTSVTGKFSAGRKVCSAGK